MANDYSLVLRDHDIQRKREGVIQYEEVLTRKAVAVLL